MYANAFPRVEDEPHVSVLSNSNGACAYIEFGELSVYMPSYGAESIAYMQKLMEGLSAACGQIEAAIEVLPSPPSEPLP